METRTLISFFLVLILLERAKIAVNPRAQDSERKVSNLSHRLGTHPITFLYTRTLLDTFIARTDE